MAIRTSICTKIVLRSMNSFVFLSTISILIGGTSVASNKTLLLGVDFEIAGFIPAMDLALKTIKDNTTFPFNFKVVRTDSKVSRLTLEVYSYVYILYQ